MSSQNKPTIVLVHGLWADGSCWSEVISRLHADGFEVISVQNPLTSLPDDIAAVQRALARVEGDAILVGHSWGGFVISAAGGDERVKGLVYVAALVPDTGDTLNSLAEKFAAPVLFSHLNTVNDYIWIKKSGIPKFAGDVSQQQQDLIYATQGPANSAMLDAALQSDPAWKRKPSWYVLAQEDGAVNPDLQRFMSERIGAVVVEVKSSHVPMISHPDVVFDLIRKAAEGSQRA